MKVKELIDELTYFMEKEGNADVFFDGYEGYYIVRKASFEKHIDRSYIEDKASIHLNNNVIVLS